MRLLPCALLVALAAGAGAAPAGTVTVNIPPGTHFSDAGSRPVEEEANLRQLTEHLQDLGRRVLPPEQTLRIDLLDVDLAGEVRPSRHRGQDLRVDRGGADWPKMRLRFSLQSNGKAIRSGEESIADMDYLNRARDGLASDPLRYEKRMLTRWFESRFAAPAR
jgi:hypothetical protein